MGPSMETRNDSTLMSEEDDASSSGKSSQNGEYSDSAYHSLEERADSDEDQMKISTTKNNMGMQTESDPVAKIFITVARDILDTIYPENPDAPSPCFQSPYTRTVVRLVNDILEKHGPVYASIVKSIKTTETDRNHNLTIMCDELFKGEKVTWGRILALFAVCYAVALHYGQHKEDRVKAAFVCNFVGRYLSEKASKWVRDFGGWDTLEKSFPQKDALEQTVWKSLLMTGLSLGVLATVIKAVR